MRPIVLQHPDLDETVTQSPPTPVPDHGTGWGLLFLFIDLYAIVALLGVGAVVAIAITRFDRQIPKALHYLLVAVLLLALGLSGIIVLLATTAQRYDVVALLLLIVFLPLTLSVRRHRGRGRGRLAALTRAAIAWSLPFLVGFGVLAFVDTQSGGYSPAVAGVVAVSIVVAGTMLVERLPFFPDVELSEGERG